MAKLQKWHLSMEQAITIALSGARPVSDIETGELKSINGMPVHTVSIALIRDDNPTTIDVRVIGEVPSLTAGTPVEVVGLTLTPWEINGRHGISFQADAIRPVSPPRAPRVSTGEGV